MRIALSSSLFFCLVLGACGGDDAPAGPSLVVSWDGAGLPALGANYEYEGWVVTSSAIEGCTMAGTTPVCSTGKFSSGTHRATNFTQEIADVATAFVLSIEPKAGDAPEPAATKLLGGALDDAAATTVDPSFAAALGFDYAEAEGEFFLATPTTAATDDEGQGIWFGARDGARIVAGIEVPDIAAGWKYEGWVVDTSTGTPTPISTGTFASATGKDDGGAGTAGPDPGPDVPGEDFINPPRELTTGHNVVISIEPSPDNDPAPFALKPLSNTASNYPTGSDKPQFFTNVYADSVITGTATFNR